MKKMLKILFFCILSIVLLIVVLLIVLAKRPFVPDNYTETVKTGGALEAKYISMGDHEVNYMENPAMMSFKKYEIYYPADVSNMDSKLPVVIFVNGTGAVGSKYQALQKHLASWGFITVATEEEYAWNGFSAEMSIRYLKLLNEYDGEINGIDNVLRGKIDLDKIGITGHSQGGFGVVNAITEQRHASSYKAAVILSCSDTKGQNPFQWEADDTLIKVPTLIMGSTGNTDSVIAPLEGLQELYNSIPDNVTKVLARRNDADHGEMLYYADGYVTAWFMYYLADDVEAGNVFFSKNAEILSNPLYQDIKVKISSEQK
ncbi:poly(ethylene terephthalate) hydrolase family protein [Cellulosilyticum sp. WCF-2]|uniref:poly(ethylene terephthalate) hydrolase family protein n=1 Tax=Cellulosilyticum sp. WCF-2 TaxID=2497860 RepID=UPI000F8E4D61|nr:alpha/beta hydrolase [Cellulosilyticum sp. WCF-2]QEH69803.1 alpha/beta hydrolase [Cellulosilyticum sp. WCF-2]